jgi:hypothetical protein
MLFNLCVLTTMVLGVKIRMQNNCKFFNDSYVFLSQLS